MQYRYFSTKTCVETFKIQSGTLNCNSQKLGYLFKFKICGEAPYIGKTKAKFGLRFKNYKSPVTVSKEKTSSVTTAPP